MTSDVVVVGGGPAGSATAVHLARAGFAVTVLDRARFPRDKPCGEFLSPAATPLLEDLGVRAELDAAGARRLCRIRIVVHGAPPLDLTFPTDSGAPPWGYAISRRRLDALLLDRARAAGAEIVEGVRIDGLRFASGRVAGVTARSEDGAARAYPARVVVGAGGRNCPVARALGLQRRARRRRYDLLARWTAGGPRDPADGVCELRVDGDSYVAAAPIEAGRHNVNVVLSRSELRRDPEPAAAYRRIVGRLLAGSPWTAGAPDEDVQASDVTPLRAARRSVDGALLVGDSALFLDPFTGQGLYLALRGAALAATAVERALRTGSTDRDALASYERSADAEFGAKRRVSQALQAILFRPRLARAIARALRHDADLAATLAAVTGDLVPARRVWSGGYAARLLRALAGHRAPSGRALDFPLARRNDS